ncbi:MAG: hypothetical protein ABIG96_01385 [Candidatus Micrarchaeota archaeon]
MNVKGVMAIGLVLLFVFMVIFYKTGPCYAFSYRIDNWKEESRHTTDAACTITYKKGDTPAYITVKYGPMAVSDEKYLKQYYSEFAQEDFYPISSLEDVKINGISAISITTIHDSLYGPEFIAKQKIVIIPDGGMQLTVKLSGFPERIYDSSLRDFDESLKSIEFKK